MTKIRKSKQCLALEGFSHCMPGLGQGYATRFVYRLSGALFFDDTRLTNPDTSGATAIPLLEDQIFHLSMGQFCLPVVPILTEDSNMDTIKKMFFRIILIWLIL